MNQASNDRQETFTVGDKIEEEFDYQSPFTVPPGTYQVQMVFEGDEQQNKEFACYAFDMTY